MTINERTIKAIANAYIDAEQNRTPVPPLRDDHPEITEEDAYRIQYALVDKKRTAGATVIGKKAGATNAAGQASMDLDGPTYATLFAEGKLESGATVDFATLIHPRLECEVAFLLKAPLHGPGVTADAALAATKSVMAAFEIVDPRTADWQVKMPEMIADNVFAARIVLSDERVPVDGLDLAVISVTLHKNGEEVAASTGANVLGNPANAVAWLANRLADHGQSLQAGEIVMAGSLTPLHPIAQGDEFEAVFSELGSVTVRFS